MFADTLKKLKTQKGLTQIQLANLLFVNKATISKWESGCRLPAVTTITRLAEVLEVDVATLLSATVDNDETLNIISGRQQGYSLLQSAGCRGGCAKCYDCGL